MEKFPGIGGAKGIFEIFIPGIFLLLNILTVVYCFQFTDQITKKQIEDLMTNSTIVLLVTVPFGYLAGVGLRLLRTETADRMSAIFLRLYYKKARGGENKENRWAYETFPYNQWLATLCEDYLPRTAKDFYIAVWANHSSKQFVNFCKVLVSTKDTAASAEIYSAESLSRYISGMFYALVIASLLLIALLVVRLVTGVPLGLGIPVMIGTYILGLFTILKSFRFIRIKEVETIFAACFKNRDLF